MAIKGKAIHTDKTFFKPEEIPLNARAVAWKVDRETGIKTVEFTKSLRWAKVLYGRFGQSNENKQYGYREIAHKDRINGVMVW